MRRAWRAVAAFFRWAGGWLRRIWRASPLRVRLVVVVVILITVALTGAGIAATATMNGYLVGRIDAGLRSAAGPLQAQLLGGTDVPGAAGGMTPNATGDGAASNGDDNHQGLPSVYVVEALDAAGTVVLGPTSNLIDRNQPLPKLPHLTVEKVAAHGQRLFTVDSVEGDGHWRVLVAPTTLANGQPGTLLTAQSMDGVQETVDQLVVLLLIIGVTTLAIITAIGYLVIRASMRPLRAVEAAAAMIAAGDLTHRVPDSDPRTEVGHLAVSLNTMLGGIEAAFADRAASEKAARSSEERMRRFVADASHELRTPLTSIRGFAELFRKGATTGGADLGRMMRRIEDEAARMGLLVDDLLLLARMDQQRPLAQRPVDMLALAGDAVLDARAVAPDRPIELKLTGTDPPPIVIGDEARLRQVLGNLMANALRHTPTGTPVTVTVGTGIGTHSAAPAVTVTVTDEGPGLSADSAARVFERFYRADPGRNRSAGGTGLGLAIVAALITSHGGHVDVTSQPGAGACFRIELPLAGSSATPRHSPAN
ncbi:MAG: HAMP domain-containing sensor histidine kinase [Nakamurella sp.]